MGDTEKAKCVVGMFAGSDVRYISPSLVSVFTGGRPAGRVCLPIAVLGLSVVVVLGLSVAVVLGLSVVVVVLGLSVVVAVQSL